MIHPAVARSADGNRSYKWRQFSTSITIDSVPPLLTHMSLFAAHAYIRKHIEMYYDNDTHRRKNSIENHITTIISMTNKMAIACSSYSWIVEKTLKAKHVNTMKNLLNRNGKNNGWRRRRHIVVILVIQEISVYSLLLGKFLLHPVRVEGLPLVCDLDQSNLRVMSGWSSWKSVIRSWSYIGHYCHRRHRGHQL